MSQKHQRKWHLSTIIIILFCQVLDLGGNNLQILPREVFSRHGLLNLQKLKVRDHFWCQKKIMDDGRECSRIVYSSIFQHSIPLAKALKVHFSLVFPLSHSCFPFLVWFLPLYLLCFLQKPAESCPDNTANYFFLRPPVWRQHWSNRTPVTLMLKLSVEEVKLCKILKHIEKYFIAFYWAKLVYS